MTNKNAVALVAVCCVAASLIAVSAHSQTRISYATEPTSFGELTVPDGEGPFPVVAFVHGGCWSSDRGSTAGYRTMAAELAQTGIAGWNLEYRRVGHDGGGWPGTFLDLGNGVDFLSQLAKDYPLNVDQLVIVGHSSGGHFAAWLATRPQLPRSSEIYTEPVVHPMGVVLTDAFINPKVIDSTSLDGQLYCGEPVLERLMGGTPESRPENLKQISPLEWLPWGIPQEYVVSTRRYPVSLPRPLADGRTTMAIPDYPALAVAAGDSIHVQVINDAEHLKFGQPEEESYVATILAIKRLLNMR